MNINSKESKRKQRQFYAEDLNGCVRQVTGYECPPNDGYWWSQSLGFLVRKADTYLNAKMMLQTKLSNQRKI
jgi:hypothetical protein